MRFPIRDFLLEIEIGYLQVKCIYKHYPHHKAKSDLVFRKKIADVQFHLCFAILEDWYSAIIINYESRIY